MRYYFELRVIVEEASIPVRYQETFSHTVSHNPKGILLAFTDNSVERSIFFIGADGIRSIIRTYLTKMSPVYSGQLAITCAMLTSNLLSHSNTDYSLPTGAFTKPGPSTMVP